MKYLILILIISMALLFSYDPQKGTGGESALVKADSDYKPLALITGSSRGIGAALAKKLDQEGYRVIIHGRNNSRLEELAGTLTKPQVVVADFATPKGRQKIIDIINQQTPDLFINNAVVYGGISKFVDTDPARNELMLKVNLETVLSFTQHAANAMLKKNKHGIILNISSLSGGLAPMPNITLYSSMKQMITTFSQGVDFELKNTGIRVLTAQPGYVATHERLHDMTNVIQPSEAANFIYYQIENRITVYSFNFKNRIFLLVNMLVPDYIGLRLKARPLPK